MDDELCDLYAGCCCRAPEGPADGPGLVAGAIGRGLTDAAASYRRQLVELWPGVVEQLPDD